MAAQGFSGGFFLPAQRSVHCAGGFFAAESRGHPVAEIKTAASRPKSKNQAQEQRTSDQLRAESAPRKDHYAATAATTAGSVTQSSTRWMRPRHRKLAEVNPASKGTGNVTNNQYFAGQLRRQAPTGRSSITSNALPAGDVHSKFELAMQELNEIKADYDFKQHRQLSAPALGLTHSSQPKRTVSASSELSSHRSNQEPPASVYSSDVVQPAAEKKDLNSPRQRLQVAEMVMRKLYKKNLQTEQEVVKWKELHAQALLRINELESASCEIPTDKRVEAPEYSVACATGQQRESRETNQQQEEDTPRPVTCPLPTAAHLTRIDEQQLTYLRHLAAEQDKTIASLKIRIEELSVQLTVAKQQQSGAQATASFSSQTKRALTPRKVVNRLQSKLQDAMSESERQKMNCIKMKKDFQHLLGVKTKSLTENPTLLHANARELIVLMEKKIQQLDQEHLHHLSLINSKLYATEQQTCESYVQSKLMEQEMERMAQEVRQRDEIDMQIEQCMVGVFERLRAVEQHNLQLQQSTPAAGSNETTGEREA